MSNVFLLLNLFIIKKIRPVSFLPYQSIFFTIEKSKKRQVIENETAKDMYIVSNSSTFIAISKVGIDGLVAVAIMEYTPNTNSGTPKTNFWRKSLYESTIFFMRGFILPKIFILKNDRRSFSVIIITQF